jgi:L-asparagine oxygenase
MIFDEDLMVGVDPVSAAALTELGQAITRRHLRLKLEPGDLLIIDNHRAVHGRGPFKPKFDGTDRWLQRAFVVQSLPDSDADLQGRVITTKFGEERAA